MPQGRGSARSSRAIGLDIAAASVLTAVLTTIWAALQWDDLSVLVLPDTDDMMRLAQVRDWLGGQPIDDLTQYRVTPPTGMSMHWSRLGDLGIAAIILLAAPFTNRATAELTAVIAYPALLFATHIFLSARIARHIWSPQAGGIAAVLAALALPGVSLFLPGRIDHHGLQIVMIQLTILFLLRRPVLWNGVVAGSASAASLTIGLETAPHNAVLIGALGIYWVVDGRWERLRLVGFALGLGVATLLFVGMIRPQYWSADFCDGFTPASVTGALATSACLALLAAMDTRLTTARARAFAGIGLGLLALGLVVALFPTCVAGPYGKVSPFLRENYITHIAEARSIFRLEWAAIFGHYGLLLVASTVAVWALFKYPRRWRTVLPVMLCLLVSAIITPFQLRGIYIGLPLCAPIVAVLVLRARSARRWRSAAMVGAWLVAAGITYVQIPRLIEDAATGFASAAPRSTESRSCKSPGVWRQLDRYPSGSIMTSTSSAAYVVGATRHSTIGAGYHRNDKGNMALYRFFLGSPDRMAQIAAKWNVDYVLFCPGDFSEGGLAARHPGSLAAILQHGQTPPGFEPLPLRDTRLRLYRIDDQSGGRGDP